MQANQIPRKRRREACAWCGGSLSEADRQVGEGASCVYCRDLAHFQVLRNEGKWPPSRPSPRHSRPPVEDRIDSILNQKGYRPLDTDSIIAPWLGLFYGGGGPSRWEVVLSYLPVILFFAAMAAFLTGLALSY